ncbi:MAG TPA: hypothetical protein VKY89_10780 [Thermoanaerobaculia bacterium]|nr:hypothetical protein [Thermoanaerobaculia bacterium]
MPSEYEPLFAERDERAEAGGDLAAVQELFRAASGPYLRAFWSWLAWALVLPAAALATPRALAGFGPAGALLTWSAAILVGGAIELTAIRGAASRDAAGRVGAAGRPDAGTDGLPDGPRREGRSPLATWALRTQGNLSFVALALSVLLLWQDLAWALPGLWLLLLGHSFYLLGGIAFPPFRSYGLLYQLGGIAALWPGGAPLPLFALTTATANLWMAYAVWQVGRQPGG